MKGDVMLREGMPAQWSGSRSTSRLAYFALAILGFSFWFFVATPFASHRETYWWLATVHSNDIGHSVSFISSTYRPLFQFVTWVCYLVLDPGAFPTDVGRQFAFQLLVYCGFVLAWWLIYQATDAPRVLAIVAAAAGAVFFSGYVHLFHIYGVSYVPVMLMIGAVLLGGVSRNLHRHEWRYAALACVLVAWHPFAAALFVGYFFGHYLETFRERDVAAHRRALAILAIATTLVIGVVFALPRLLAQTSELLVATATRPADARLSGWLVSFQTNEVHWIASLLAFVLALAAIWSMPMALNRRLIAAGAVALLAWVFAEIAVPLLLLWMISVLLKLICLRRWALTFALAAALVLPFGGGIGAPTHALFALVIAVYATALGWSDAERHVGASVQRALGALGAVAAVLVILLRLGVEVPVLTRLATPLLAERERTYQAEVMLDWLRRSDYCDHELTFAEESGNPVDSVQGAITRRYRPPAAIEDARLYWNAFLRCNRREPASRPIGSIVLTFGDSYKPGARALFELPGRYAGPAIIWLSDLR